MFYYRYPIRQYEADFKSSIASRLNIAVDESVSYQLPASIDPLGFFKLVLNRIVTHKTPDHKFRQGDYTTETKLACSEVVNHFKNIQTAIDYIHLVPGLEKLHRDTLIKWAIKQQIQNLSRETGRPIDKEFRRAIIHRLIYIDDETGNIVANCIYNLDLIRRAAEDLRREGMHWDASVNSLLLSDTWLVNLMAEYHFVRRKISTYKHKVPKTSEVRRHMHELQTLIRKSRVQKSRVINFDETAFVWALQSKYQYIPANTKRALVPGKDAKERATFGVATNSLGEPLPSITVLKTNCKSKTDLRSATKLSALLQTDEFSTGGWVSKLWEYTDKAGTIHYRPYLINEKGDLITLQHKAWMDAVLIIMWAELIVAPWAVDAEGKREPVFVVWDNFRAHTTDEVKSRLLELCIRQGTLPPNMTSELQPMDLIVNFTLKSEVRKRRASILFDEFCEWAVERSAAKRRGAKIEDLSAFDPPAPTVQSGIQTILSVLHHQLTAPKRQQSLSQCFIDVGIIPREDGTYVEYNAEDYKVDQRILDLLGQRIWNFGARDDRVHSSKIDPAIQDPDDFFDADNDTYMDGYASDE